MDEGRGGEISDMSCAFVRAFMHHPALTLAESMEAPREWASDDRMIYRSDMESPYCILHNLRAWERDPGGVNDTLGAIKLCTFGAPGSARRVSRVCKGITYSRDVQGWCGCRDCAPRERMIKKVMGVRRSLVRYLNTALYSSAP